jgi:uncharacterized protein (DUF1330 family)
MDIPRGYVVAQITVTDPVAYPQYVSRIGSIIEKFGGAFLVRGGASESFEGTPPGDRTVVIEFPSLELAQQWYHSPDYAEAKALRQAHRPACRPLWKAFDMRRSH